MNTQQIKAKLSQGETKIGPWLVHIKQRRNRRYYALLTGPLFNTIVDSPPTVHAESLDQFLDRLAQKLSDLIRGAKAA